MLLGEDLHDPYGGAFKVTAGLSTAFPGRVISTPISEAGMVGAGIGLALAGFRPVVEVMFADFLTLAMDQIYNHAVKFPGMFPRRVGAAGDPHAERRPARLRPDAQPEPGEPVRVGARPDRRLPGSHRHDVGALLVDAGAALALSGRLPRAQAALRRRTGCRRLRGRPARGGRRGGAPLSHAAARAASIPT